MVDPIFTRGPGMTPSALRLVRYAMLAGVLLFGGFAYYQSTHRPPDFEGGMALSQLRWVGFGLCAAAIVGMALLRQARERADAATRPNLSLIGSALGEAAALFGGVYMLLGGDISVYALAVVIFLASWTFLPADSESV